MTKDEYLRRLIKARLRLARYFRFYDAEFATDELVIYNGITYYPEKLLIGCDREGMYQFTCKLHSLTANSTVEAELHKVLAKEDTANE